MAKFTTWLFVATELVISSWLAKQGFTGLKYGLIGRGEQKEEASVIVMLFWHPINKLRSDANEGCVQCGTAPFFVTKIASLSTLWNCIHLRFWRDVFAR